MIMISSSRWSTEKTAIRIARVLRDRDAWLQSLSLPQETEMDYTQRGKLMSHLAELFAQEPGEKQRDEENRVLGCGLHCWEV